MNPLYHLTFLHLIMSIAGPLARSRVRERSRERPRLAGKRHSSLKRPHRLRRTALDRRRAHAEGKEHLCLVG